MNAPLNMSDRERELLTLAALGELTPEDQLAWQNLIESRPELRTEAAELQSLTTRLAFAGSEMPAQVLRRLDEARSEHVVHALACPPDSQSTLKREQRTGQRTATRWRSFSLIAMPLAAAVVLGFFFLQEQGLAPDPGFKSGPVSFPEQAVQWIAPGPETRLLQPTLMWKGTPGKTYSVQITDSTGKVLASASDIQSPWLVETPLPVGARLTLELSATGEKAPHTHLFQVLPGAAPLSADLLAQMQALAAAGNKTDALMLLMRLPEDALSPEAYAEWKKKLSPDAIK